MLGLTHAALMEVELVTQASQVGFPRSVVESVRVDVGNAISGLEITTT